jgi:Tfp pilus assembly protein PilX
MRAIWQASIYGRSFTGRRDDQGVVLMAALGLVVILGLVGGIAAYLSTTNTKIGGNERISANAFFVAEAGTEEARARLRGGTGANQIVDTDHTNTAWRAYIGTQGKAEALGYDSSNALHTLYASLQQELDYVVEIRHATDAAGNIEYWGDPDQNGTFLRNTVGGSHSTNVYVITSYGSTDSASKTVEIEVAPLPPPSAPGPLYVEATTNLLGSSTYMLGADLSDSTSEPCGDAPVSGIATPRTEAEAPITQNGGPNITGSPAIQYGATDIDIQAMINSYKQGADFSYNVTSETQTGTDTPGPGDGWGDPNIGDTLQDPSTCDTSSVVYYNTNDTYIKFSGGVTGCGILLIDGDLDIHGNFYWYGAVIISGHVIYSGGGDKHITGTVMSEGSADIDVIGGNANNIFCTDALASLTSDRPLRILSWREVL